MNTNAIIGCAVLAGTLLALVVLVLLSRRRIERIAQNGGGRSARHIVKDMRE